MREEVLIGKELRPEGNEGRSLWKHIGFYSEGNGKLLKDIESDMVF